MARRVGDDELAQRGGEVAVRDVDRDALLALGGEAVGQQRQVERLAALLATCASMAASWSARIALRVVEQAADQRALAVVHAAGGEEAQHAVVAARRACSMARHQKYPSFLRNSIDASLVWSSRRVAPRSVIVARGRLDDDRLDGRRVRCHRRRAGDVADGAEAHRDLLDALRRRAAASASVTGTSAPPRRTTGRACASRSTALRAARARCTATRRARSSC